MLWIIGHPCGEVYMDFVSTDLASEQVSIAVLNI